MVGRSAVILYLAAMLMSTFISVPIEYLILILGTVTILYTLLGGMEAVVWTDVMQSAIMGRRRIVLCRISRMARAIRS